MKKTRCEYCGDKIVCKNKEHIETVKSEHERSCDRNRRTR